MSKLHELQKHVEDTVYKKRLFETRIKELKNSCREEEAKCGVLVKVSVGDHGWLDFGYSCLEEG